MAMVSEGAKAMRAVGAGIGVTPKERKPYVEVICRVVEGVETGSNVKFKGWLHTPDSAERTITALRVMGWRGNDLESLRRGVKQGLGSVIFLGEVKHEAGQGENAHRRFAEVAFVNERVDAPKIKHAADANVTAELNDQLADLLRPPPPPGYTDDGEDPSYRPEGGDEDDLPDSYNGPSGARAS